MADYDIAAADGEIGSADFFSARLVERGDRGIEGIEEFLKRGSIGVLRCVSSAVDLGNAIDKIGDQALSFAAKWAELFSRLAFRLSPGTPGLLTFT